MAGKYKKYTQLEHVLARPDTYVGSVTPETSVLWVLENDKMVQKEVSYVPALYKIFDEIIVNCMDQAVLDPTLDAIKVSVKEDTITVLNTGKGIPIEMHEEQVMVPELIFGNLLTSENYDDTQKRTTGGRNGYGAKLTNIFSQEFTVEIVNPEQKKKYVQTWKNNMKECGKASITKCANKKGYVSISFTPDLKRFGLEHLDPVLFQKRVYDCCACTPPNVKVYYNDVQLPFKTFEKYVDLFLGTKAETPRVILSNERWEVCAAFTDGYKQVSFVNGIHTTQGGSHVDQVLKNMISKIQEQNKKHIELKPTFIKEHLFLFVKATLENPTFSSQTKTECTSKWSTFGSRLDITDEFIKKVCKLGILQEAQALAKHKEQRELEKTTNGVKKSTLRGIPKLDDANHAGSSKSDECTLILTEGDSAKTFAISGLSVVGRNQYGVFPLRGKLLNTREASAKQLQGNEEITNLVKIIGLKYGTTYSHLKELRYGKIMILTDSDLDGYHIRGLIMNFIHSFWPSLMKLGFICSFKTPIMKATRNSQSLAFYTIQEYEQWKTQNANHRTWKIKYYKGLGTSTGQEAKEYFKQMDKHLIDYEWKPKTDYSMEMAFKKEHADNRKLWIQDALKTKVTLQDSHKIPYEDFVNKELVHFSIYDNIRSIPSLIDGLKPSQRKVIYACLKRSNTEIKVSQLSGYVSVETQYHHGEMSLQQTIVSLAQDFVGTGHYHLLEPIGQFGTRLMGGKDSASPRYIFTRLSGYSEVFHKDDSAVLKYLEDDGHKIEPEYYVPILPLVLLNGAQGIGTGYSTDVPCYSPESIKENIKAYLEDTPMKEMIPSYKGFKGKIVKENDHTYTTHGVYQKQGKEITITELPIGKWTDDYKEHLEKLIEKGLVKNYKNHSTEETINFVVTMEKDFDLKELKLTSTLKTSNMWLFDEKNVIHKYDSPVEILTAFCKTRMEYYKKRKTHLLEQWNQEISSWNETYRFIQEVIRGDIVVFRRKKQDLCEELKKKQYKEVEHLISISLLKFTHEELEKLEKQIQKKKEEIATLTNKTEKELYLEDLR